MRTWQPWTITSNTLQLAEWPDHGQGVVVVEGDMFGAQEVAVVDLEGDIVCHTLPPRVGSHDTDPWDYADVVRCLFAHIDTHPQTHYTLRTLHPERVRECWPDVGRCGSCGGAGCHADSAGFTGSTCGMCRGEGRQKYRDNVTLSLGPLAAQADADRLCPLALGLADLCSGLELWCRPVERIQFPLPCRDSVFWGGFRRITVTGGAQPLHPDNVRCLRDQAVEAGVAFAFLGWGEWWPESQGCGQDSDEDCEAVWQCVCGETAYPLTDNVRCRCGDVYTEVWCRQLRVGRENSGNTLDGRTWPWKLNAPATPGEG